MQVTVDSIGKNAQWGALEHLPWHLIIFTITLWTHIDHVNVWHIA